MGGVENQTPDSDWTWIQSSLPIAKPQNYATKVTGITDCGDANFRHFFRISLLSKRSEWFFTSHFGQNPHQKSDRNGQKIVIFAHFRNLRICWLLLTLHTPLSHPKWQHNIKIQTLYSRNRPTARAEQDFCTNKVGATKFGTKFSVVFSPLT